eukprot:137985-Amphidinium_carterae.1
MKIGGSRYLKARISRGFDPNTVPDTRSAKHSACISETNTKVERIQIGIAYATLFLSIPVPASNSFVKDDGADAVGATARSVVAAGAAAGILRTMAVQDKAKVFSF